MQAPLQSALHQACLSPRRRGGKATGNLREKWGQGQVAAWGHLGEGVSEWGLRGHQGCDYRKVTKQGQGGSQLNSVFSAACRAGRPSRVSGHRQGRAQGRTPPRSLSSIPLWAARSCSPVAEEKPRVSTSWGQPCLRAACLRLGPGRSAAATGRRESHAPALPAARLRRPLGSLPGPNPTTLGCLFTGCPQGTKGSNRQSKIRHSF